MSGVAYLLYYVATPLALHLLPFCFSSTQQISQQLVVIILPIPMKKTNNNNYWEDHGHGPDSLPGCECDKSAFKKTACLPASAIHGGLQPGAPCTKYGDFTTVDISLRLSGSVSG